MNDTWLNIKLWTELAANFGALITMGFAGWKFLLKPYRDAQTQYEYEKINLFNDILNARINGYPNNFNPLTLEDDFYKERGYYRHPKLRKKFPPAVVLDPKFDFDRSYRKMHNSQ